MTTATHFEAIDPVLDLIARASKDAERLSQLLASEGGQPHLVEALATADRDLHAAHLALWRSVTFGPTKSAEQLRIAG